jgi:hypothetical protein
MTTDRRTHQRLINEIQKLSTSMGLKLKPSKCRSLSLVAGLPTDIKFTITGNPISTLQDKPHKFLGSQITFTNNQRDILNHIRHHFVIKLDRLDNLLIRDEHKTAILRDYLLPSSRFILTVHELSKTSLNILDAICHRYMKSWTGLKRSTTPAILHLDQTTAIPSITYLYQQCQTNAYTSSRLKADRTVNAALDSKLAREQTWTRKFSTTCYADNQLKSAQKLLSTARQTPTEKSTATNKTANSQ